VQKISQGRYNISARWSTSA